MDGALQDAWNAHHETKGRAVGAMEVAMLLEQPQLADARRIALRYLEEAGEAYAALERALMAAGRDPDSLRPMNEAFWTWATTAVCAVSS